MTGINDENTRASARRGADAVCSFLAYFSRPDATWEGFGKTDYGVEYLRLHALEMLRCIEAELQNRAAVEPTEFGT